METCGFGRRVSLFFSLMQRRGKLGYCHAMGMEAVYTPRPELLYGYDSSAFLQGFGRLPGGLLLQASAPISTLSITTLVMTDKVFVAKLRLKVQGEDCIPSQLYRLESCT